MKTALLIDDDLVARGQLAEQLRNAGWKIFEANDGQNGIDLALKHPPDLILCDLQMADCNGYHVCRALRRHRNRLPKTRIIVTTSSGYTTDRLSALEAGAHEYVVKPVLAENLIKLLNRLDGIAAEDGIKRDFAKMTGFDTSLRHATKASPGVGPDETRVRFWGVRGSIPTPGPATSHYGGNTACVEVRADGEIVILDAGTGIRPLGAELVAEYKDQPIQCSLLISHTHWDHIQGFPFFAPAYNPKNHIRIFGFEGAGAGLESTFAMQMESPYFPIFWKQLGGHLRVEELKTLKFQIGKIPVEAAFVNHPGITVGYRLNTSNGIVAYLPDNEPYQRYKYHAGEQPPDTAEVVEYARRQDERIINFVQDADVLILDAQYDAEEYQTRIGWGHGCVDDVVALALRARAKRLFLFHHDPSHDDEKMSKMVAWAREFVAALGEDLVVEASREGLELVLKAEPVVAPA